MGFPITQTTHYFNLMLAALIDPALAAPTVLAAAKQGLSMTPFSPAVDLVFASITEPTFTGYAQSATIVWGAPVNQLDGSQTSLSPAALFRATAVPVPETIYGGFITDGVAAPGSAILGSYNITPNYAIENPGDGFSIVTAWNLGPASANCYGNQTL